MSIPYTTAYALAEGMVEKMAPYCERPPEIAGSLRRRRPEVGDIEIVAVPKWAPDPAAMFGEGRINLLYERACVLPAFGAVTWIKTGTDEIVLWSIRPDGKYWRGLLALDLVSKYSVLAKGPDPVFLGEYVKLDLFLPRLDNFGLIYAIRTGSAEFSKALVTHAARIGMPVDGGYVTRDGEPVATPEERDVFDLLGLKFIPPEARVSEAALVGVPRGIAD